MKEMWRLSGNDRRELSLSSAAHIPRILTGRVVRLIGMILKKIGADIYVIEGQGEATSRCVIQALKKGPRLAELTSIPNLLVFDRGSIQDRRERKIILSTRTESNGGFLKRAR